MTTIKASAISVRNASTGDLDDSEAFEEPTRFLSHSGVTCNHFRLSSPNYHNKSDATCTDSCRNTATTVSTSCNCYTYAHTHTDTDTYADSKLPGTNAG